MPSSPVLIIDPNRGYRHWLINEIYVVGGDGRHVPNEDDSVLDWEEGLFRVTNVDYTTGVSTLEKWEPPKNPNVIDDQDVLLGAGPGTVSESYRVYVDQSVFPYRLACDRRLHLYGSTSSYIKIFHGTNIGVDGDVISMFFDNGGTLLGENIPLELVAMPDGNNRAVKAPMVGYTNRQMDDGEVVTAVVYGDQGHAVSIAKMLVRNTAFVRSTDLNRKFIRSIGVDTPFLSSSDPTLIQYPINMPVDALNLMGVVNYSDGTSLRMPIDGTKFSLLGLENYVASIQGQVMPIVLSYKLGVEEFNYQTVPTSNKHITAAYRATTMRADGAYSLKLFVYPVWISAIDGYRLEAYLYDMNRSVMRRVTSYIQTAFNSPAFDPILYGTVQHISLAVDLNRIDSSYANYRHVQSFAISLLRPATDHSGDAWTVQFSNNPAVVYGSGINAKVHMVNQNYWEIDLTSSIATFAEWKERVFYKTEPLFDSHTETEAPAPTHFVLVVGLTETEYPIDKWDDTLVATSMVAEGTPIYLKFLRRNPGNDLQLGVSGLVTRYIDA